MKAAVVGGGLERRLQPAGGCSELARGNMEGFKTAVATFATQLPIIGGAMQSAY